MLEGKRVVLREFRTEDVDEIQKWVNNPHIKRYLGFGLFPQSYEESKLFVETQLLKKNSPREGIFVIALKEDPQRQYIGSVGLHRIDYRNRHAVLGIVIGREDLLDQGIGREAIDLLLGYAFDYLNLNKVNLGLKDFNLRAYHCYLKAGFKEEGRVRMAFYQEGSYCDEILMGITRDEYYALKKFAR